MAEPIGDTTTATGQRLRPGEFLRDASGNWFRVYDVGGGKLRLAPVTADGKLLAPKSQWKSPSGAYENELGQLIQTDIQGSITTTRTIPWSEWAGGAGGGGTAAPQWRPGELGLEQQGLDIERQRLQADIAATAQRLKEIAMQERAADERQRLQLQAEREMLEKRLDNDNRALLYGEIGATKRTLMQEQAETGREVMRLGPDWVRQAAILSGGVQRGITPQQTAVGQAQAFMQQPLPQASMDMSVAQLEGVLGKMGGIQQPQMGGFGIGMAQGGVIEMERGGEGAFSMKPKMSYLVGEGKHGEGLAAGTAEILTIGGGKVEVTPFGGGAYSGLEQSVFQGLSPLYSDFGWAQTPTARSTGAGFKADPRLVQFPGSKTVFMIDPYTGQKRSISSAGMFERSGFDWGDIEKLGAGAASGWDTGPRLSGAYGLDPSALSQMGISPDLVSFGGSKAVYYRDPATSQMRLIPSAGMFGQAGFNWSDIANMGEGTRGAFDFGPNLTAPPPVPTPAPGAGTPAFGALGTVMVESTTGAILPAIHKVARQLAQWKAAGDYRYDLAVQAYGNALDPRTRLPIGGLSSQYIDSIVSAATPGAGGFGGRRIGFTGGWMG